MYLLLIVLVEFLMTTYSGKFTLNWRAQWIWHSISVNGAVRYHTRTVTVDHSISQAHSWTRTPRFSSPAPDQELYCCLKAPWILPWHNSTLLCTEHLPSHVTSRDVTHAALWNPMNLMYGGRRPQIPLSYVTQEVCSCDSFKSPISHSAANRAYLRAKPFQYHEDRPHMFSAIYLRSTSLHFNFAINVRKNAIRNI